MASKNPYKSINIDREKMIAAVEALGATDCLYQKAGSSFQLCFTVDKQPFKLAVYENGDGSTTLSKIGTCTQEEYDKFASQIASFCAMGNSRPFEVSIARVPTQHVKDLLGYLKGQGETEIEKDEFGYHLTKLKGHQGDVLTIKYYANGTIQLQGRWAKLASHAHDFLTNVLPYETSVKAQIDSFHVPITVAQAQGELEARLPLSFGRLGRVVCAQLTSALVLFKVNVQLPDYGAVAFPALRGLEGFIKAQLLEAGFDPAAADSFGEYFKQGSAPGSYVMNDVSALHAGEPLASLLAQCYTLYKSERHSIAHMNGDPETSRMVDSMDSARNIVTKVFDTIEHFFSKLATK